MKLPDPNFFQCLYDEDFRTGNASHYEWQIRLHKEFAAPQGSLADGVKYTDAIRRIALVANNGSGKSQMILAPCAGWLCSNFDEVQGVVTSASGAQLDRQSGRALKRMLTAVNTFRQADIWKINYRQCTNTENGSIIDLFATDEAGKAEGFHPIKIGGMMGIFVDEAKTISEDIFKALTRCNGVTHRLDVSSVGASSGHFYNALTGGRWRVHKITSFQCPHITADEIEEDAAIYGESSAFFRSKHLSEFTSQDEQTVMAFERVQYFASIFEKISSLKFSQDTRPFCGVDLGFTTGGDECVVSIWQGNVMIAEEFITDNDIARIEDKLVIIFNKYGLEGENIAIDDGNIGRAVAHNIRRRADRFRGIRTIVNQSSALRKDLYLNRGAELWFNFARIIKYLRLAVNDPKLVDQLGHRYYKQNASSKLQLESKKEAKAHGRTSPDRADATVLAWSGKQFRWLLEEKNPYADDGEGAAVADGSGGNKTGIVKASDVVDMMEKKWLKQSTQRSRSSGSGLASRFSSHARSLLGLSGGSRRQSLDTEDFYNGKIV